MGTGLAGVRSLSIVATWTVTSCLPREDLPGPSLDMKTQDGLCLSLDQHLPFQRKIKDQRVPSQSSSCPHSREGKVWLGLYCSAMTKVQGALLAAFLLTVCGRD